MTWTEPICFHRRLWFREVRKAKGLIIRSAIYGMIAAGAAHVVIVKFALPITFPIWTMYAAVTSYITLFFVIGTVISCFTGRPIGIHSKRVTIVNGTSSRHITFDFIERFRIGRLPARPTLAYLALRYTSRKGRRRTVLIGVPIGIDCVEIDEFLRERCERLR